MPLLRKSNFKLNWYLILFPFFVLIHFAEMHYPSVPVFQLLIWLLIVGTGTFICWFIFYYLYRNSNKAAINVFYLLFLFFFFGWIQDSLKTTAITAFLARYSILLPLLLLMTGVLIIILYRTGRRFSSLNTFLTLLMVIWIIIDLALIINKQVFIAGQEAKKIHLTPVPNKNAHPDIYLLLFDEYAGETELNELLDFDNSQFYRQLEASGLQVFKKTNSNYHVTQVSMSSMLSLNYIVQKKAGELDLFDLSFSAKTMEDSPLWNFLLERNYTINNYSIFEFAGTRNPAISRYEKIWPRLFLENTLYWRLRRDLFFHLLPGSRTIQDKQHNKATSLHYNQETFRKLEESLGDTTARPQFYYAHFMMPHSPYLMDSAGNLTNYSEQDALQNSPAHYLGYLRYTNRRILDLIEQIRSKNPDAIILLMSDHGFRQFEQPVPSTYYFSNLNAVYLPPQYPFLFYDGMSNVNQFRVLLNSVFQQKLPLLKDSSILLKEVAE